MTQADFTVANQTFPNTRAEINTSLQALATNSAGNSAPSTTFANQWWFDSDGNKLYMRNKDNDAWVEVLTIGATSDKVETIGETGRIDIASAETVFNEASADIDTRFESNTYANILTIDAGDDNVTLGVNNIYKNWYDATNTYEPLFQQTGSSYALAAQSQVYQNGANNEGAIKYFGKSRSAAGAAGYGVVASGDLLGNISFQGADGSHFIEGAGIRSYVDGTPAANDIPAKLQFFTNEGTSGATARWTLEANGNFTPSNTAYGIHLGVTTATASNLLDDYEEGTWTIVVEDHSSNAMTTNASYRQGSYVKVGGVVHITGYVAVTALGSASGVIRVTGLPFNISNNARNYCAMTIGYAAGLNITAGHPIQGVGIINTGDVNLTVFDTAAGTTNLSATEFSADGEFIFSMTYTIV